MSRNYNMKYLLVHLRDKLNTNPTTPPAYSGLDEPPNLKEKRKREADKKRKLDRAKKPPRENPPRQAGGGDEKPKLTAWPERPAEIAEPARSNLRTATKEAFNKSHCHAYLIGRAGCTRPNCTNGSHSPPSNWKEFLK